MCQHGEKAGNSPHLITTILREVEDLYPFARAVARKVLPLAYNNSGDRLHTMATRLEGMFASPSFKFLSERHAFYGSDLVDMTISMLMCNSATL